MTQVTPRSSVCSLLFLFQFACHPPLSGGFKKENRCTLTVLYIGKCKLEAGRSEPEGGLLEMFMTQLLTFFLMDNRISHEWRIITTEILFLKRLYGTASRSVLKYGNE